MEALPQPEGPAALEVNQSRKDNNTCATATRRRVVPLRDGWNFRRCDAAADADAWTQVGLPHSPFVADLDGRDHWFGECEYEHEIQIPPSGAGARAILHIGAAMHTARVFVDGREVGCHVGGYLPFEVELPPGVCDGRSHGLRIRVDNRHDPDVPPGKPFDELDFCWYGGLYRDAELRLYPPVHITDAVAAGAVAGGGVFVRTLAADAAAATLAVRVHVRNTGPATPDLQVRVELAGGDEIVTTVSAPLAPLGSGKAAQVEVQCHVAQPRLWSPDAPSLYDLHVAVVTGGGAVLDARRERVGIRRIHFSRATGFVINGRRVRLRGTNRHQEYPRVGYAAPRAAQYRDARRIKEAGFDYVRLSHYPQSPDFLAACDELGIVVMNCLPGWQFIGGERFRSACFAAAREMIRRDRNHPCVVLWELSLNETVMDDTFTAQLHAIGHEEYPGDQMYTCGWLDRYDVYLRSRQHGEIHTWRNGDKALVVAEYGDWEFFAANDGFNQKTGTGLFARWSNGRKFRGDGERGLRQQAWNHMVALNDTLASPAALDGQWSMFDYARGYDPVRAGCGLMDVFRLPKFSYHFYRSQRDPAESGANWVGGPVVFIASHWTAGSDLRVPVFSNCEAIELRLNGAILARQPVDRAAHSQHLPHPPFFFDLDRFSAGTLEAHGLIGGRSVCVHRVTTPGPATGLRLTCEDEATIPAAGEPDVLIAHAELRDAQGALCVGDTSPLEFAVNGAATLLGARIVRAEAGIASVVLQVPGNAPPFTLRVRSTCDDRFAATRRFGRGQEERADASPIVPRPVAKP